MSSQSVSFDLLPHSFFTLKDGGRLRYARFSPSPAPRGTVLVVPGAREFIEKKYIECGKRLLDRGFRVIIYEPRGQGLSSRFLKGDLRQRTHIDDFSTHLDDLRAFYDSVVLPGLSKPLIVHGHSLGAHILLRWLAEERPAKVAGAFMTGPMIAVSGMAAHLAGYGLSLMTANLFGQHTSYAPMQHDFGGDDLVFANNPLTGDERHFQIFENYFKTHPELMTGGVTWGWMLAAVRSMSLTHAWPYLANIDVPVLALAGDQDPVTPPAEIVPYLSMIPQMRMHVIPGARHDLFNETDIAQAAAWRHIDDFIKLVMEREKQARLNSGQPHEELLKGLLSIGGRIRQKG
jgi:lysophospholipase